jgi:hypothetical protein
MCLRVGQPEFDSRQKTFFFFPTISRQVLVPTQPGSRNFSQGTAPEREANHSVSSGADVKNAHYFTTIPAYAFM